MINEISILLIIIGYFIGLYFLANYSEKKFSLSSNPIIYMLSIAVYCTAWTYFGNIGMMVNLGYLFLTIFLGPILVYLFFYKVIEKIIQLKDEYQITSIAEFLSIRYGKSARVAIIVTFISTITMLPYISLQLTSIMNTFELITQNDNTVLSDEFTAIIMLILIGVFVILLGIRKISPTERHPGLITVIALESIMKLVAMLIGGIFIVYFVFDGFGDIYNNVNKNLLPYYVNQSSGLDELINWSCFLIISMAAIIFLPRQFHVTIVEGSNNLKIKKSRWYLIGYLVLINMFIPAITFAGVLYGLPVETADSFFLQIPIAANNELISLVIFIGGFSAASSMIMITTVTLSTMISNHVFYPIILKVNRFKYFQKKIIQVRWLVAIIILILSYLYSVSVSQNLTLQNTGIISFVGIFQLVPIGLGAILWKRGTKIGAIWGLVVGFCIWFYTLIFPILISNGFFPEVILSEGLYGYKILRPEALFNIELGGTVANSVLWSFLFNAFTFFIVSKITQQTSDEKSISNKYLFKTEIENILYTKNLPANIELNKKVEKVKNLFDHFFDEYNSSNFLKEVLKNCNITDKKIISLIELARLKDEVEKILTGTVGSAVANSKIKSSNIFEKEEMEEFHSIYVKILDDLNLSPYELIKKIDHYKEVDQLQKNHAAELEEKIKERETELLERKRVEKKLRDAESKYRGIFENAVEGIFQSTIEGEFITVNPALVKILGYDSENELLTKIKNIKKQLYVEQEHRDQLIKKVTKYGHVNNFKTQFYRKDSSIIWVAISANTINDDNRVLFMEGTITDISDQIRAESELIKAKEEAERADKLKSNFLAQMSHEIRTPINSILNFSALLRHDLQEQLTEDNWECFNSIESGANRLMRTIDLILNISDVEAGTYKANFKDTDIYREVLFPIKKEFHRIAKIKKLKLNIKNEVDNNTLVKIDQYTFTQIIANLIDNAIKYTETGSVDIFYTKEDNNFIIKVSDTGIGISKEYLPSLFQKFSQEQSGYTRRYEGNGLGLALVKNYCEINNLDISVESEKGVGTTFKLIIPQICIHK